MKSSFSLLLAYGTLRVSRSQNCHLFTPFFYLKPLAYMVLQIVLPLMIKHPSKLTEITAYTLSVLRIFVHSVSCHFSCENSCNSNFSVKLQHSLLDFCYLTIFSDLVLIINFNSNFLLEAGQILERSQWIQIL